MWNIYVLKMKNVAAMYSQFVSGGKEGGRARGMGRGGGIYWCMRGQTSHDCPLCTDGVCQYCQGELSSDVSAHPQRGSRLVEE